MGNCATCDDPSIYEHAGEQMRPFKNKPNLEDQENLQQLTQKSKLSQSAVKSQNASFIVQQHIRYKCINKHR